MALNIDELRRECVVSLDQALSQQAFHQAWLQTWLGYFHGFQQTDEEVAQWFEKSIPLCQTLVTEHPRHAKQYEDRIAAYQKCIEWSRK